VRGRLEAGGTDGSQIQDKAKQEGRLNPLKMKDHKKSEPTCQQARAIALKQRVAKTLRWTDLQYATYQYEQGCAYLMKYLNGDGYSVSVMERSRIFWNWWKNHWMNRDEGFLEFVANTVYGLEDLRTFYSDVHDAETLAACIYPNGVILNESYAVMVAEFVGHEKGVRI
jgi:hypothetical protein